MTATVAATGDDDEVSVPESNSPPLSRHQFGRKLQSLREQAGLTLSEAASRLDKSRSALHRVETGDTRADVHLVRSMMDLYHVSDPGLIEQARDSYRSTGTRFAVVARRREPGLPDRSTSRVAHRGEADQGRAWPA